MIQRDYRRRSIIALVIVFMVSGICIIDGRELLDMVKPPVIKGKLVYHSYTSYDAWDSKIYLFDFETKVLECLNDYIEGTYHTMNACFNAEGTQIVFMGVTNQDDMEEWHIFRYTLATKELEQLTSDLRNEDPKFSPDGKKVVYKQGKWDADLNKMIYSLCEMDLETKKIKKLTNDINEKSMPYYSSDGQSVYYIAEGESKICNLKLDDSQQVNDVFFEADTHAYYPIAYKNYLYFTKFYSKENTNDMIIKMDINNQKISIPRFNDEAYNSSDTCPLTDGLLIISSTRPDGEGGYDLYIVDEVTGHKWSLSKYHSEINNAYEQLGASCYIEQIDRA